LLYHGTRAEDFEELEGPAWVSTSEETARYFVDWHGDEGHARILTFRAKKKITGLARIDDEAAMRRFTRIVDPYEDTLTPTELSEVTCKAGYTGWDIPHNYGHGESDTLLCDPMDWLEFVESREVDA